MPKGGATLPEALLHAAKHGAGELIFHLEEGPVRMTVADLAERAQSGARALAARGIGPGDAVGVLGPNRPEWVVWAWATWAAGATLVPLQIPPRIRDPNSYEEQLKSLVEAARCRLVMTDPGLVARVPGGVAVSWEVPDQRKGDDPALPGPDDAAVIQFTSGSTAAPKGALITHAAVLAQMENYKWWADGMDPREYVLCGWVPFFHDLGLFFYIVRAVVYGSTCHYLPTERFAADPVEWLRLLGSTRATGTVFPPSAMGATFRAAAGWSDQIDLSCIETASLAAEGIDPTVIDRILESAERFRFRPEALIGTYGLAEAVLGVTSHRRGEGLHFDRVSLAEMAASGEAVPARAGPARRVASCGSPPPSTELRIVRSDEYLPERQIGEVCIRGPSLMQRYVGQDAPDPFVDGWLRTGDLGYLADGQLYITGRMKDMVIVLGNNYYPEDFEWAAGRLAGVRAGRCVAFSDGETERVVLLVEPGADADPEALPVEVRKAVINSVGISPGDVLVVPRGTVEKTTSGKLRRSAMRDAYRRGELLALSRANWRRT